MSVEALDHLAALHVPQDTGGIPAAGQELMLGHVELATGQVGGMSGYKLLLQHWVFLSVQRVDSAFIVETAAGENDTQSLLIRKECEEKYNLKKYWDYLKNY